MERMTNLRETVARVVASQLYYQWDVLSEARREELCTHYGDAVLAALGLDDLPTLAQRGATGLAEGPWSYEHEGVGHEPVKRDEIAHAVLSAAFSATEGPHDE